MKREYRHRELMLWITLLGLILLTACSHDDGEKPLEMVKAQFNFSLPLKRSAARTRMSEDVVQKNANKDNNRGITDVRLLCYDKVPTKDDSKIGNIIEIKTSGSDSENEVTENDLAMCEEISIPVTTNHFGFYARAQDTPRTHQEKMQYGIIETVGLTRTTYQDNSTMRFKPVPICTSTDPLGGSEIGSSLLTLLNDLMGTTATGLDDTDPNKKWATVDNLYLNEAYKRMTQLKTLSSFNVQTMLIAVKKTVDVVLDPTTGALLLPDNQGAELATALSAKIGSYLTTSSIDDALILKPEYRDFPEDLGLPAGAARVEWDADQEKFVVPDSHAYGTAINVSSLGDYVYPMNLQYQVMSSILASDNIVIQPDASTSSYEDWNDLLTNGYADASDVVSNSTQSVAMVSKVDYAVGRMALRVRLDNSAGSINDANGHGVDITNGFTLTGYIVGGQREVDFEFTPVAGSKTYAIYDSYLDGASQEVQNAVFTAPDYILGLGTDANAPINVALELVNNCHDFQGEDGVIAKGATFYLVATLDPSQKVLATDVNKIFDKDYATDVSISIKNLSSATYGLPDLDVPHPTVGISVNLTWEEGLWYDNVVLTRYVE